MANNTLMRNIHPVLQVTPYYRSAIINRHNMHFWQVRLIRHRIRMPNHCMPILITPITHFNNIGMIMSAQRSVHSLRRWLTDKHFFARRRLGAQMEHNHPEIQPPFPRICPHKPIIITYNPSTHILTTNRRHHILDIRRTTILRDTRNLFLFHPLLVRDIE